MKKLVYNTPHGQLSVTKNGIVTLRFEHLYMQISVKQFTEFVQFINSTLPIIGYNNNNEDKTSFYYKLIKNMKKDYLNEFKKLINAPIYSPDDNYDIFDYLKLMKSKQIGVLRKNIKPNLVKIDKNSICLN